MKNVFIVVSSVKHRPTQNETSYCLKTLIFLYFYCNCNFFILCSPIHPPLPPLPLYSISWINILLDRGLCWIDSPSELHRKASFFLSHSGPYWRSYLFIFGLAELLHFLARSLSLHLRLFASLSPPSACFCPHLSPQIFFFSYTSFYHLFLHFSLGQNTYFYSMILSAAGPWEWHIFSSWSLYQLVILSCFPVFVFGVGPQQSYLCFAHLSLHYLLCHGTVNVSDRDRSCWKSTPWFVLCLFCYPSLTLFLFISGRRAGPSLYLVAKFTHWKGREASNKQLRYS